MTAQPAGNSGYGSANDWAKIIQSSGEGAGSAMQSMAANAASHAERKEAKRRTLANLLNQALKRNQNLQQVNQEYGDDMSDFQSQALQNTARGFVNSLRGSTRGSK